MPKQKKQKMEETDYIKVPLVWRDEEATPITFSNQMFVRHEKDIFIVSFGQVHGPYMAGEITKEQAEAIGEVQIDIVSRLAISQSDMKRFIDVLEKNYKRYLPESEKVSK